MIDRCRKCDGVGEKIEKVIDRCSESAYLGRHNQLAKTIHQQTANCICYLLETLGHPVDTSQKVLESANMILYGTRLSYLIIWWISTDLIRMLTDRENKTALVKDTAVPSTHTFPN